MKKDPNANNRREFLKNSALAGGFFAVPFGAAANERVNSDETVKPDAEKADKLIRDQDQHEYNGTYTGEYLNRVAFPIGGIGAGMVCMEGTGAISHVSVYNMPDFLNEPTMFAAISVKGIKNGAKVLEGQVRTYKLFGRPDAGNGYPRTSFGLPRFDNAAFEARFPSCTVKLKDDDIPLEINITGWSPFIPLDADNSSLPCGAIEYSFENTSKNDLEALFSYNARNFMIKPGCKNAIKPHYNGFILSNMPPEKSPDLKGDFAIFTDDNNTVVDHCWFRGKWCDPLTVTWKHIQNATPRITKEVASGAPGASLYVPVKLKSGEKKTVRLMMAWYSPDTKLTEFKDPADKEKCDPASGCCPAPFHQPWYSSKFKSIHEVSSYWQINYKDLKSRTELFTSSFYNTSLPNEVVEAVAANLTILKSPTVLRQKDGRLWGWEGCRDYSGCCPGSCTHVWNYAQSIPHLFPSLERSLRETEFKVNQSKSGRQAFRAGLPIREIVQQFPPAADGQLGGIMKVYREWRISGDNDWMKNLYPYVKTSIDWCINEWDPNRTGSVNEPHHNTYDIEFWGANGMCTSFYLGALQAFINMGNYLKEDVSGFQSLLEKGVKVMEDILFDGEYFTQKIQTKGLKAPDPVEASKQSTKSTISREEKELLEKEGPKYQYGTGCLSDGIIGIWMAKVCGLDENIIHAKKVKSHLESVFKYNFRSNLRDHPNPQRPAFAAGDDAGLLICSWPKEGALSLPFIYSNEIWTGIEYQVASHLMFLGNNEEALRIVRALRKRYDGRVRNPFNEYECGGWYARAMSSYGMIQGLTGIRYDAVNKTLYIDSQLGNNFDSFFSCNTGFGNVGLKNGKPYVKFVSGTIDVKKCMVSGRDSTGSFSTFL